MNKKHYALLAIMFLVIIIVGCTLLNKGSDDSGTPIQDGPGDGRVITGQEALDLYGVDSGDSPISPTSTPLYLFPAQAWVLASSHPYDPNEDITILPMFTRPSLDHDGTWMGDLEAGMEVVLHSVSPDGLSCLVEGTAVQGWTTQGWVACNRLSFSEVE